METGRQALLLCPWARHLTKLPLSLNGYIDSNHKIVPNRNTINSVSVWYNFQPNRASTNGIMSSCFRSI